jgi:hypothetical protein
VALGGRELLGGGGEFKVKGRGRGEGRAWWEEKQGGRGQLREAKTLQKATFLREWTVLR